MLQRAASNAYSWWWASNIRTKQSKWLDNDLQEMEARVKATIKLIDEDADSFAKKAEMYFKRRPELINSVEEAYRAYKALADRYDRISRELHKANHTISTALPDHVPLNYEDDEDDTSPKSVSSILSNISSIDASKFPKPPPELPRLSSKIKKPEPPKSPTPQHRRSPSSNLTQESAKQEIDRLQKKILVLQTEKEFFKSSYERGLAKYWEIEREMNDMQDEISALQDEFNTGSVIEDDEARALMAASALKSCEVTLVNLHEQQKKSLGEANLESQRIHEARCKLKALKGEDADIDGSVISNITTMEEEVENLRHERLELQSVCDKVKEMFLMNSESSVAELAEKIDELVDKVIGLEVTVSSQTSQVASLKEETDDLHKHLEDVEEDKKNHNVDPNNLNERLNQVEQQLQRILELERKVQDEKGVVKSHFAEACNSLNDLSDKIQSPIEYMSKSSEAITNEENKVDVMESVEETQNAEGKHKAEGGGANLSYDYTSIIQNFEETKKRLTEMEKKNEECHSETMQQIQELRCANAVKDEEIKALRKKLFSAKSLHDTSVKKSGEMQKLEDLMVESDEAATEILNSITEDLTSDPSPLDEKFRGELDALLEENLDFWLRFSTSYHQIQKFQTTFKEIKAEAEKEHENKDSSNNNEKSTSMPSDKKLREFNTELQVWLEHNGLLQGELRSRFSSLCNIQDEITKYTKLNENEEAKLKFTPYQAAKFQGEVINMQQENNKVAKELQAGLDHVKGLQREVETILSKLHEKFELSDPRSHTPQYNQFRHFSTRSRVPLKTFLFAAKPKKTSIFACMNPVNHRHHIDNIKNMKLPNNKS